MRRCIHVKIYIAVVILLNKKTAAFSHLLYIAEIFSPTENLLIKFTLFKNQKFRAHCVHLNATASLLWWLRQSGSLRPPRVDLTDLGAFSQREREAETFEAAVRVEDHIGGRVVRVGVLQRGHERGGRGLILVTVSVNANMHARGERAAQTSYHRVWAVLLQGRREPHIPHSQINNFMRHLCAQIKSVMWSKRFLLLWPL